MKNIALIAAILAGSSAAYAGQSFDSTLVATGTQRTQAHVIGEGHIVLQIQSDYESIEGMDANNPIVGTSGSCFGAVEIKGGNATGGGNCVFKDADGDAIANTWNVLGFGADGALIGTWVNIGGSGKFTGISGGGSFNSLTDNATGKFRNEISGAALLP